MCGSSQACRSSGDCHTTHSRNRVPWLIPERAPYVTKMGPTDFGFPISNRILGFTFTISFWTGMRSDPRYFYCAAIGLSWRQAPWQSSSTLQCLAYGFQACSPRGRQCRHQRVPSNIWLWCGWWRPRARRVAFYKCLIIVQLGFIPTNACAHFPGPTILRLELIT